MNSLILGVAARILAPLLLAFSVFMLLRGHNLPGGGFIGGLIAALGFVVQAYATSAREVRKRLPVEPRLLSIAGFGLAVASGLIAAFAGVPFFTGVWVDAGGYALSSVLLFDIGVYLTVFGAVLALFLAFEEAA